MAETNFEQAFARVGSLVEDFRRHERDYLAPSYSEQDVRKDFIDKFWIALGWDVNHETQKNPNEQEVKVERGVGVEGRVKKADYAFLTPNFRDVRFFVEAKKPARNIDNADDYFQTIRYGWNAQTPVSVLTDFQEFRVLDCRLKPDVRTAKERVLRKFHYTDYADAEKFAEIYYLFSREAAHAGALEKFAAGLARPTGRAVNRRLFGEAFRTVDEDFLQQLDDLRDELARSFKNRNPGMGGEELTEATQRTLDRLVFMRFLEDKLIEPEVMVEKFGDGGSAWGDFVAESKRLNGVYNGIIFREHFIDGADFVVDERVFAPVCERLSHTNTVYNFNYIPIHVLGSIYERFLGKVIVTTDKRARLEEKPEVRKAGGVYYTPEYIVRYIVAETVGRVIAGRTPAEIAGMRFADIACGSGSFLLGVFDELLRHHTAYYNRNKTRRAEGLRAGCVENADGTLRLSLKQKKAVLTNNIYGVDLDAQAVEVAQLSLFLKLLEEETTASARGHQLEFRETMLPDLRANIKHGNSLVGWDIGAGLFGDEEERKLYPLDFAQEFPEVTRRGGFDAIVGNPPYVFGRDWKALGISPAVKNYLSNKYKSSPYQLDMFSIFMERALGLCRESGYVGQIVPNVWLTNTYSATTRTFILSNSSELCITAPPPKVFQGLTVDTVVYTCKKASSPGESFSVRAMGETGVEEVASYNAGQYVDGKRPISISVNAENADLAFKLSSDFAKLSDFADITRGVHPYRLGGYGQTAFGSGFQTARDVEERPYHSVELRQGYRAFIYGKDLKRFTPPIPSEFISYGPWLAEPRRADFFEGERVYSRKILGDRLVVTLETTNSVADQQVYITKPRKNFPAAAFLAGVLGSALMAFFIRVFYDEVNDAFPQIKVGQLQSLPIPALKPSDKADRARHDRMVGLVEAMLAVKRQLQGVRMDRDRGHYEAKCAALDRQIDQLVYELYELTPEEIAIVEGASA
jgi:adenine-specific DNA-methyltransferase